MKESHGDAFKCGRDSPVNGPRKADPGSASDSERYSFKQVAAGKSTRKERKGKSTRKERKLAAPNPRWYSFKPPASPSTTISEVIVWGERVVVTLTNEASVIQRWIQRRTGNFFGLDVEWRPTFVKGQNNKVALLQLCEKNDCLIIQMLFLDIIPNELNGFLMNGQNAFVGVGIGPDAIKLSSDYGLICAKMVELTALVAEQLERVDLKCSSLKRLVQEVLGFEIKKPNRVTMSNWSKRIMDSEQVEYAAIDAWASSAIFHKLMAAQI